MRHFNSLSLLIVIMCGLLGCQPTPSLTRAELTQKYPEKRYVDVDGVALHYEQAGLGPPVVFLHGILTSSVLWRTIVSGLTYGNTIYTVDLMGFGFSEKPQQATYSLDVYAAQLGRMMEMLHLDHPVLIGHGFGAAIAVLYTIRHPGAVEKLVLMDAPFFNASIPFSLRVLRAPLFGEWLAGNWIIDAMLSGGVEQTAMLTDAVRQLYRQPYQDDPGAWVALRKCVRETNLAAVWEQEIRPGFAALQLPILLLWSSNDAYVPVAVGRALHDLLPQAQIEIILRSGHYVQEDRPEEVRAVLKAFLMSSGLS